MSCSRADMPRGYQGISETGVIDEILVFSRALTEGEIQAHATRRPLR